MRWARQGLIGIAALAALLAVAEIAVRTSARLLNREPLLEADPVAGWRTRANLDTVRVNADGQPWRVQTDGEGLRVMPSRDGARRRLLIVGDSFAFGEGVDIEQRFDAYFSPLLNVVNTGTMGYGTEQAYLRAASYLKTLGKGDIVLVLFYRNDFDDVLRRRHLGRPKPYMRSQGEPWSRELATVPPHFTAWDRLQDWSYLATVLSRFSTPSELAGSPDYEEAARIILGIFGRIEREAPEGVTVFFAEVGSRKQMKPQLPWQFAMSIGRFERLVISLTSRPEHFLRDGHWNAAGHRAAGEAINNALKPLLDRQ